MKYFVKYRLKSENPNEKDVYVRAGYHEEIEEAALYIKKAIDAGRLKSGDSVIIEITRKEIVDGSQKDE